MKSLHSNSLIRFVWPFGQFLAKHTRRLFSPFAHPTSDTIVNSLCFQTILVQPNTGTCVLSERRQRLEVPIQEVLRTLKIYNKSQDAVLIAASWMQANMVAVQGPQGVGKARTLRDMIIALTKGNMGSYHQNPYFNIDHEPHARNSLCRFFQCHSRRRRHGGLECSESGREKGFQISPP